LGSKPHRILTRRVIPADRQARRRAVAIGRAGGEPLERADRLKKVEAIRFLLQLVD
jgi:hypothetical protein